MSQSRSTRREFIQAMAVATAAGTIPSRSNGAEAKGPRPFEGKVVAITGATSGIGEAAARAFARDGAKVFFCGRRKHLGAAVEKSIREAGGEATYVFADVRKESSVRSFIAKGIERYGRLDVAFNNAGIGAPRAVAIADLDEAGFDEVFETNAKGVFYSMKHEIPHMLKTGGGVIVNMASIAAHKPYATMSAYSASKASVVSMTKSAAAEYGHRGIRIGSVSPGWVDTAARVRLFEALGLDPAMTPTNVLRRLMTVDEVVSCVLFACSPAATGLLASDLDLSFGDLDG